jgi:hypothetical protein
VTARADTLTLPAALEVCWSMRPLDVACIEAIRGPGFDREAFALDRWQADGAAWEFSDELGVYAIGGLAFTSPWCGSFWLLAQERIDGLAPTAESWRKLVRVTRTVISNALDQTNPHARHRVEAHVLVGWPAAQRLVRHLGFIHEGTLKQAGSRGEDFEIWAQVAGGRRP